MSTAYPRRKSSDLRPRTTLALRGVTRKANTPMSHQADLAIGYAQTWLARQGSPKVPAAAVVWRALDHYMRHLDNPATVPADEVRAVKRACEASKPDEEARQAAFQRLHDAPESKPIPGWRSILYGPSWAAEREASEARFEATLQAIEASSYGQRRGFKAAE